MSERNKGKNNYFYGKHLKPYNYKDKIRWVIKAKKNYTRVFYKNKDGSLYFVYEHREIIQGYLNRKLNYDEVVHHVDGNIHNNNIDNLKIYSRSEHARLHKRNRNKLQASSLARDGS